MGEIATAEITVVGIGSSDPGASGFLAAIHERLAAQSKVKVEPRGTGAWLEGELDDIFALSADLHRVPIELGMPQVCTILKLEQHSGPTAPSAGSHPTQVEAGVSVAAGAAGSRAVSSAGARASEPASQGLANGGHSTMELTAHADWFAYGVAAGLIDAPEHGRSAPTGVASTAPAPIAAAATSSPASAGPSQVSQPIAARTVGLTKSYGEGDARVDALRGIDLELRRGEFVAVMGPSGSGKSTLMHILGALEAPTGGTVEIGGVSYAGLDDNAQTVLRRDRIGFVFQFFNLVKTLSAEENVMLPSLVAGEQAAKVRPHAGELLELVGLGARRDHLPSQMSGGEQQRVSIARALMRSPQLVLADEPTGNLDTRNSSAVLDLLGDLQATSDHTILMVTHDPVAACRATRVVFLCDGLVAGEVPGGDSGHIAEYFSGLSAPDAD